MHQPQIFLFTFHHTTASYIPIARISPRHVNSGNSGRLCAFGMYSLTFDNL